VTTIETTLQAEEALRDALSDYAGQWIALRDEAVVASAPTLGELLAQIESEGIQVEEIFEVSDGQAAVGFFIRA
jgi:hypothetical protein